MRGTRSRSSYWIAAAVLLPLIQCSCNRSPEARVARFLDRAKKLRATKDFGRADLELKNAISTMPKAAEPYYQLGLLYMDRGMTGPAAQMFAKATTLDPHHNAAQVKLSQLMVASREKDMVERSEVQAQDLVASAPKDLDALNLLALTELKAGKPQDASHHLEEALKIMPADLKAAANLAAIKLVQRDFAGAEKVLQDSHAAMPKSSKPCIALGRFYLMMRKPAEARKQFQLAVQMDPNDASALRDAADLARAQGDFQEASGEYQRLSRMPPADNRVLYGRFLFEQGKYTESVAEFERLLKTDPNDRETWLLLMAAYVKLGRRSDADRIIADALKRNPNHIDALLQRAQMSIGAGKLADAQTDIQKVLSNSKNSAAAHYLMGTVRRAMGDDLAARQEFSDAVNANPRLERPRAALAQVLIGQNSAKAALDLLRAAPPEIQNDPHIIAQENWALMALENWAELRRSLDRGLALEKNPEFLLQDGIWKVHQKDYLAGEKSLAEALDQAPNDTRPLKVMAGSYMVQKKPDLALQKVTEYAARSPKNPVIQQFLGDWLMQMGRPTQAKAVFTAIKVANPNYFEADLSIVQAELAEGQKDDAKKRLADLMTFPQVAARASLLLGTLQESDGNPVAAMECYRAVLQMQPQNVIALNNLAYLLAGTMDGLDSALQYATQARNLAPATGVVQDTLGWILFRKGQYKRSVQELEGATATLPTALPKYHLAMAYAKNGEQGKARTMLDAALKLDPGLPEANIARSLLLGAQ
jgi:Tfp pilus assembly protein PilF